ncbi:hypothetical protein BU15DRAFT_43212, partial [Melanogaster broomeanus]
QLPLSLLTAAQNKPMLVELKNGETFNGHLVNCDNFMNITLREVYQTSADGDRFWKLKECYIRGSTIKYLRVPDTLLDAVKEEQSRAREAGRSARGAGDGNGGGGRGAGGFRGAIVSPLCVVGCLMMPAISFLLRCSVSISCLGAVAVSPTQ